MGDRPFLESINRINGDAKEKTDPSRQEKSTESGCSIGPVSGTSWAGVGSHILMLEVFV